MTQYHEQFKCDDGSIAVKPEPGDKWIVIKGDEDCKAHAFAEEQNRHWSPWHKQSIIERVDDR